MLRDLVNKPQKTEPRSILYFRRSVITFSLILLITSFVILCHKVLNEKSTISSTFTTSSSLPAPAINLAFGFEFNISCLLYYDYHGTIVKNCDEYVQQPKLTENEDHSFVGNFLGNISLKGYGDEGGVLFVFLNININNKLLNLNDSNQETSFRMIAFDSEDTQSNAPVTPFEESLFYLNKYTVAEHFIYKLGFSRKFRKTLVPTLLTYIGFQGTYVTKPYIESIMQIAPMISSNPNYLTIRISPRSFIVEEEQEQRNGNIINILGNIAALYSSIVFIYVFLFGVDSMRPWGFVHKGCCGFRRFEERTKEKLSQSVRAPDLEAGFEERILYLEKFRRFLEKNVIDASLLESIGETTSQ
ncbi:12885_t:CDS:2 [Funneliformis geosporum]|uniref:2842_t:CDS:1 n=1 Tax=Funneliformis geosporum TaxID=1117311 RepID=A0A9W4WK97_9GLOM|nr:2842_t:CDS:2 [Funneliformis geosporum]CAI2170967.1 12885_t:CDS:2 [Funneliformis geosporum]